MSENLKPVTPQDVLADGAESAEFQGLEVRKGSIKATIDNVKALEGLAPGSAAYEAVADQLRALKPALVAVGLFDVFDVKNSAAAAILGVS
jgi:hypothetical protein